MKPAPFRHHEPTNVAEATAVLREYGDEAKVLAGGQSLVPMLALRLTRFEHLVDVNALDELTGITLDDNTVRIGAATRQRVLERDERVAGRAPLFAAAAPHIGHFQIRNRGTVGGSIAHADPASELPAVAVALEVTMETSDRSITAESFFTGTWTTAMADDELLVAIRIPVWTGQTRVAVREVTRRQGDFALAGAVVQVSFEHGTIARAAIALFGLGPTPVRAHTAEAALIAGVDVREVADLAMLTTDPNDDIHATAQQRRRIGATIVRRAIDDVTSGGSR